MNPVILLLQQLNKQGIRLFLEEGELRFKAPKGAMTPALMAELKASKPELVKVLIQAENSESVQTDTLSSLALQTTVPLSYAQQRLWFLFKLEGASSTYNILLASRFKGRWDVDVLIKSFQYLVQRHECLRTTFSENSDGVVQQTVHDSLDFNLEKKDFSSYSETKKQQLLKRAKTDLSCSCFNIEVAPLSRIVLIHYGDNEWILLIAMHHIIGDGWSLGILSRELREAYLCYAKGRTPKLPDIKINYRDYSLWQQRPKQTEWIEQGIKRWCKLLENSEYKLDLNTGKIRPESRSYQGSKYPVLIDATLSKQLELLAEKQGVSLFVLLLGAYFVLLQRYSGRNDLLVGSQAANRNGVALESIVGFFINTLVLRAQLTANLTFSELLIQVNNYCSQAFELQYVPFERLVETLKPERDFGYNPLVQVMFLWQNFPIEDIELDGLIMSKEAVTSDAAKFDLTLELGMEQGQISGVFEYSTDLFEAQTIEQMVCHYNVLLGNIVQNPSALLADLKLTNISPVAATGRLPSDDCQQNIVTNFNAQALKTPEANAVNDGQNTLNYSELCQQADAVAQCLMQTNIKAGSIVAIYLPRSNDYLVAILAILKAGCAYLPLEHSLPKARIDFILKDAKVAAVISEEYEFIDYLHIECSLARGTKAHTQNRSNPLEPVAIPPQTPAYLIYTSGSTGQPKGVLISHQSILGLVESLNQEIYQHSPKEMNVALMASFIFDASVQQIFAALLQGHCLHICNAESRRDGMALLSYLVQQNIALSDCTPSLLQIMLDAGLTERKGLKLRQLIVGGEALPAQIIEQISTSKLAQTLQVFNVYGPTECTVDATLHRVSFTKNHLTSTVSIGRPLDRAIVKIVDSYGNQQSDGLAGEIYISGSGIAQSYWQQPALTAERFIPADNGFRWYRTGDQGRINGQGEIEFLGRMDDQVKIRGYRIELGEIESQLVKQAVIQQAAVCVNQANKSELLAYITIEELVTVADLRAGLAQYLPEYMLPAHFIILDKLPLNPAGKIDRKSLPALDSSQRLSDKLGGAPKGEREHVLAQVWCEVLGLEAIGREDNFFASGGDSIKALQIVSRVRRQGLKLEVRDLFTHPSISRLAPKLMLVDEHAIVDTSRAKGEVVLSPIQQHLFKQHGKDYHHFNQAFLLSADEVDVEKIQSALTQVCERHDSFRLRFKQQNQQWSQFYSEQPALAFYQKTLVSVDELSKHAAKIQQSFDLETGALFKVVYYKIADKSYLLLIAHHLIIDAVSWRILMEDLNEAYEQGQDWQAPPATLSMKIWMQYCQKQSQKIINEQQDYWQQQAEIPSIEDHQISYTDLDSIKIELDKTNSELFLTGSHQTYSTEANDLLLSALLMAYKLWAKQSKFSLILEGHGRDVFDGIDVSRTIGWFTTRYPVTLEAPKEHDLAYLIKSVKENLRAIANKGVGYGLLRYMNANADSLSFKDPAISFNYLGQFGEQEQGRFSISDIAIGNIISPQATPPYLIEFVGKHVAGQLSFEMAYPRSVYQKQQISEFAQHFKTALVTIIQHTANAESQYLTPSDIDFDGFDINQLDDFLEQL